jgi:multidrug efflux pump subunit AcrA (membrane-fusion protein)
VKADVAESYASRIKKGSEVVVYFPDMNDSLVTKVNFVSRAINNASRTFTVEVLLDNKKEYHPNMVARLNINDYQSADNTITVPVRTIQRDDNNAAFVYVAENGKAVKKIITTGTEYRGQVEVKSGLKANDKLITLGYDLINDGDPVSFKN